MKVERVDVRAWADVRAGIPQPPVTRMSDELLRLICDISQPTAMTAGHNEVQDRAYKNRARSPNEPRGSFEEWTLHSHIEVPC